MNKRAIGVYLPGGRVFKARDLEGLEPGSDEALRVISCIASNVADTCLICSLAFEASLNPMEGDGVDYALQVGKGTARLLGECWKELDSLHDYL